MIDEMKLAKIHQYASQLEQQNSLLKNQLNEYRESIVQVCKCSGFSSWYNFTEWVFRYFKQAPPLAKITKSCGQLDLQPSCKSITRLFNQNQNLPSIEEEQFESTLSETSLHDTLRNLTLKFSNSEEDWRNQTLEIGKLKKNSSTLQFSQIEHIVMENAQLRKQNSVLRKQMESTKQSLHILAGIIEMERKQHTQSEYSTPRSSNHNLRQIEDH